MKHDKSNFRFFSMSVALIILCMFCVQTHAQIITTIAGNGTSGYSGDGGPATTAEIYSTAGGVVMFGGYLYFADSYNQIVRKVSPTGIISKVAGDTVGHGTFTGSYTGDGGSAIAAGLNAPQDVVFDASGNMYITDEFNHVIRKVNTAGTISTFAGTGGGGYTGDGGQASAAEIGYCFGITLDNSGNILFTDEINAVIRKINPGTGIITTVAGTGVSGYSGDGGAATLARLANPRGIRVDASGNIDFCDYVNCRIRQVSTSGIIKTICGGSTCGYSGDGGAATAAEINGPVYLAINGAGNIFFTDYNNNVVREINTLGVVNTVVGTGIPGYTGDGGLADTATLNGPFGLDVDCIDDIYIGDYQNWVIRKVSYPNHTPYFTGGDIQTLRVCENSGANSINSLLAAVDSDTGQGEQWSAITLPSHGMAIASYSTISTGGVLTPTGLTYTPTVGYVGRDTFTIMVMDCAGASDTTTIAVIVDSAVSPISGSASVCVGSTITLSDATTGTWSSRHTAIATVGSLSGIVTGVSVGTDTITFTNACGSAIKTVSVTPTPMPISGSATVCIGSTTTLTDPTAGGRWSSSTTSVATVGSATGIVTGVSSGTATITYFLGDGCYVTHAMTVNPLPSIISGPTSICVGSTVTLTDTITGGGWMSSNTGIATIGSVTGIVTGISVGTVNITYGLLTTGCFRVCSMTVNPLPAAITGPDTVCVGSSITLADATTGGLFSGGPSTIAIFTPGLTTCLVTGVSTGVALDTYTLSSTGCYVTDTVTVMALPEMLPITGFDTVCIGSTTTFSDTVTGGIWSSVTTSVATVGSGSGIITGVSAGTDTIKYTVTNLCGATTIYRLVYAIGITLVAPITGAAGVCSGTTDTLSDEVTGGVWTSSNPSIATVGSSSGIVTGIATGTVTITYTVTNMCGPSFVTKTIEVNMATFITTNTKVACQSLITGKGGFMLTDSTCILVCDSSTVRYYGNGDAGAVFTWIVTGGTIVHNYGDSIDVFWGIPGITGTITVYDTVSHCHGMATGCVMVIKKPDADFSASAISICLDGTVLFTDMSTADTLSPIVSWYWDFGDGGFSSVPNPSHTFIVSDAHDTVTLVVTNACGCTDTARVVLNISETTGPQIQCATVACDSETATYSTAPDVCGAYNWSVVGGTIVSGAGTTSISVKWNAVGTGGFGYVMLVEPCASGCPDTVTIKIPVILQSPVITGPAVVCTGSEYEYSLPLWPATQYMWGVISDTSAIVGLNRDYKVVVQFTTPGTYTIHGWYQNRIKLCGANADKTITVVPATTISGTTTVCQNGTYTYRMADTTLSASWTLTDMFGAVVATGTGTSFNYTFSTVGTYVLSATGSFCANPITINVTGAPAAVDSIAGPDTVCLHRVYSYTAYFDLPGTLYSWQAIGGTVTPASGSATVNVTWTSSGTKQLIVTRVSTSAPYCSSLPLIDTITQEVINPTIKGDTLPCSNSYRPYSTSYSRGEVYNWSIVPDTLGSVTSGDHTTGITAVWNNVLTPTPAMVILKVTKCDTTISDTLNIVVQPSPLVTISSSSNPACPGDSVTFTASVGDSAYVWDFGDGTGMVTTTGNTVKHAYPANPTPGNVAYAVRVKGIPGPTLGCPPAGTAVITETILPGPVAFASSAKHLLCPGDTTLLTGTVTTNVTGLTYQWYNGSGIISGATNVTYTTSSANTYYFTVTASNGCSTTSNLLVIVTDSTCGFTTCGSITAATSHSCTTISLNGNTVAGGSAYQWYAETPPVGGSSLPAGTTATVSYDVPGIYFFEYTALIAPTCNVFVEKQDTVGVVPNFRYELKCAAAGTDSIFLEDYTAYLPWWTVDTVHWYSGVTLLGTGPTLAIAHAAASTYPITEVVIGTSPDGAYACNTTASIALPALPHASFTDTLSPICEGIAINFTATSTAGIVGYGWEFGDPSSSLLENPKKTYTWRGPGDPQTLTITLTVTDSIGCTADTTETVQIFNNILNGIIAPASPVVVCSSSAPDTLTYIPTTGIVTSYLWSTGATTSFISVSVSGSYWVTVFDAHQCQRTMPLPATQVKILPSPTVPTIVGKNSYCVGDVIHLSGYDGTGVSYAWYRDGMADGTTYSIADATAISTAYQYFLVASTVDTSGTLITTCSDTSALDSVYVRPLPPAPTITGPVAIECTNYHLELTASESGAGTFNWSNGTIGAVDDIYSGGAYRVWYTDLDGCMSEKDTTVPYAPNTFFPYFPSGCYTLCTQQLPLTLLGIPGYTFSYWAWLFDGSAVTFGTGTMSSFAIDTSGTYAWTLGNGLCTQTSDPMTVSLVDCSKCQDTTLSVTITCDTTNPASYSISITFTSPGAGATYTLGTDIGPIDPFSGTLSGGGLTTLTLTYTTLRPYPLPDSITVQIILTDASGNKCYLKKRVPLPSCHWIAERNSAPADTTDTKHGTNELLIANSLLVFPNPTSGDVTFSYDYGAAAYTDRSISIYDATGRKVQSFELQDMRGSRTLSTKDWMPGVYIIRMEADGKALHTQRMVVVSK